MSLCFVVYYGCSCCFIVFFFSSRRRHTRWNCDWSSDVCSSDLLDRAGGVPALLRELGDRLDTGAVTVTGATIGEIASAAPPASGAIRPAGVSLGKNGAFAVVRGSLAPDGAVIKTSAATPALLR